MRSSKLIIWLWWVYVGVIFIFPYLFISIDVGFNVSDWSEYYRYLYVGSILFIATIGFFITLLYEFIKNKYILKSDKVNTGNTL